MSASGSTSKERVKNLLKSRKWFTSTEINQVAGTPHGTRRARELREDGYTVKTRQLDGETQYRISAGPTAS